MAPVNNGALQSIPEDFAMAGSSGSREQPMYQPRQDQPSQQASTMLPSPIKLEAANFVNAPPEYADRARDEIRKRLLQSSNGAGAGSLSTASSNSPSVRTPRSSRASSVLDSRSVMSDGASSIFSQPMTVYTQSTRESSLLPSQKIVTQVSLEDALPKTFFDMYPPEILLGEPSNLLCNGRPKFTERELLDWELNDIRSLLIIENPRPEWGNQLPSIIANHPNLPNFRFQLLPLISSDDFIIETLVNSDLYLEANLDFQFKLTSARYTVTSARKRHEHITGKNEPIMRLSKPEWRNIIENYLLNIAVEAQCRYDFKHRCSEFKKLKLQQELQQNLKRPNMPPPSFIPVNKKRSPVSKNNGSASLLRKTLMKNLQLKNFNKGNQHQNNEKPNLSTGSNQTVGKISLTKDEKAKLWSHCQAQVYQRLGLDWQPDKVTGL